MQRYGLEINGLRYELNQMGNCITVTSPGCEKPIELSLSPKDGAFVDCVRLGDRFYAKVNGMHVSGVIKKTALQLTEEAFDGNVRSPFAGKVTKVAVEKGAALTKGTVLMVVEAMKMEYPVVAPVDGDLLDILVEVGDQVALDEVVVRIKG